jgi:photosystem II stability/assembly factor-like uncharacterized protein
MKSNMSGKLVSLLLAGAGLGSLCAQPNEWTNVGPEGGAVWFMAIDPQNPASIFAGTSAGIFKSEDGGANWNNSGLNGFAVSGLVMDQRNPTTLYALSARYADSDWEDFANTRLFKTIDGGATWNEEVSGMPPNCCGGLSIDPQDARTLYAFAYNRGQLFKSTDGGASWALSSVLPGGAPTLLTSNVVYFVAVAIDPQSPSTLYAAGQGADAAGRSIIAVFKSTDAGASWKEASSGLNVINGGYFVAGALTIDPKNPRTVYVTRLGIGVYKSTDGGASWRAANSGLAYSGDFGGCCSSGVVIDPQNSNTLYVPGLNPGNPVIFKSTNGGANWNALSSLPPRLGVPVLAIDPQSAVYAVTTAGPFKSTDGGASWRAANSGLRAIPVPSLAMNPDIPAFIYAGNLLSTDAGKSWFTLNANFGGVVAALAIDPRTPSTVYAGTGGEECSATGYSRAWMEGFAGRIRGRVSVAFPPS